jgi:hypothetical protein
MKPLTASSRVYRFIEELPAPTLKAHPSQERICRLLVLKIAPYPRKLGGKASVSDSFLVTRN